MQLPSSFELKALMRHSSEPCISLYMPINQSTDNVQQTVGRYRQLVQEVEHRVRLQEIPTIQREHLLKPLEALLDDEQFWQQREGGLAIFRSADMFRAYFLPTQLKEQMLIASHFYLKPLLPMFTYNSLFYILSLSYTMDRLFEGTRHTIREIPLPVRIPEYFMDIVSTHQPERQIQFHNMPANERYSVLLPDTAEEIDSTRKYLLHYLQQVDMGLHQILRIEKAPLILAGVDHLFPLYHQANSYPYLLPQGISGTPDQLGLDVLHQKSWHLAAPHHQQAQQNARTKYLEFKGTRLTTNNMQEIVPAAYHGHIDTLFIAANGEQWGTFDEASNTVQIHKTAKWDDDELLDRTAAQTMLHDGTVYALDAHQIPDGEQIVAILKV
jgi:hypothetical protein